MNTATKVADVDRFVDFLQVGLCDLVHAVVREDFTEPSSNSISCWVDVYPTTACLRGRTLRLLSVRLWHRLRLFSFPQGIAVPVVVMRPRAHYCYSRGERWFDCYDPDHYRIDLTLIYE